MITCKKQSSWIKESISLVEDFDADGLSNYNEQLLSMSTIMVGGDA